MKYTFNVPDMSCGHCRMHIEKALKDWGKASQWTVDLPAKSVVVESDENSTCVARIIQDEGYTPTLV